MDKQNYYTNQDFWKIYTRIKKTHPNYSKTKLLVETRYAYEKQNRIGKYTSKYTKAI